MYPLIDGLCVLQWGGLNKPGLPVSAMNNDIYLCLWRRERSFCSNTQLFFPLGLFANVSPLKIWALGEFIELSTATFHGNHFDPH